MPKVAGPSPGARMIFPRLTGAVARASSVQLGLPLGANRGPAATLWRLNQPVGFADEQGHQLRSASVSDQLRRLQHCKY